MGLDDRPADRQAHAHSFVTSAEIRVEDQGETVLGMPSPLSLTRNATAPASARSVRITTDGIWGLSVGQRLEGVADQVHQDLLDLDRVAPQTGQLVCQLEFDGDTAASATRRGRTPRPRKRAGSARTARGSRRVAGDESPDSIDDLAGPQGGRQDLVERGPDLVEVGFRARQCHEAALGVIGNRPERLVELVGQTAGHLADRGRPRHMAELLESAR